MKKFLLAVIALGLATVGTAQQPFSFQKVSTEKNPPAVTVGTDFVLSLTSEKPGILTFSGCDPSAGGDSAACVLQWGAQPPNLVAAGPASGGAATWDFRSLVPADLGATATTGYMLRITGAGTMDFAQCTLLSNTCFSDASNGSAVRGSMVVANSTPAWAPVTIGTVGKFWYTDGTDPSWQNLSVLTVASPTTNAIPTQSAQVAVYEPIAGVDVSMTPGMMRGGRKGWSCFDEMWYLSGYHADCTVRSSFEGTGTGNTAGTGTAQHPGVTACNNGTQATSGCAFQAGASGSSTASSTLAQYVLGGGAVRSGVVFKMSAASTGTDTYTQFAAGMTDMVWTTVGAKTEAPNGVYLRCIDCQGSTHWFGVVRVSTADSVTCDTGINGDLANWHTYETVTNAAATATSFYIDGVFGCTATGTHPATAITLQPVGSLRTAGTANSRAISLDVFWYSGDITTAR